MLRAVTKKVPLNCRAFTKVGSKMDHCATPCCGIIPPHILEHIATCDSNEVTPRQRALAASSLRAMEAVHRARDAASSHRFGATRAHPMADDSVSSSHQSIIPAHIYEEISKSKEVSEKTREQAKLNVQRLELLSQSRGLSRTTGSAVPKRCHRIIRDAHQTDAETGSVIASEGAETGSLDDDAQRIWDFLKVIFDFYFDNFGRNSVDDKGFHLVATVHFDDDNGRTPGFMNAFWDPQTNEWYFGDGDGVIFDDFTKSVDIVAHEYAHAVTQFTANLPYQSQSGALNEHFSDVFGAMLKQYTHNDRQKAKDADWLVGEGVFFNPKAPSLRSMKEPGTAYDWDVIGGKDPQPADMDGFRETVQDGGGVHIFSGIPNRAFYLAAVGFQDAGFDGYSWVEPGKIWYATLNDPALKDQFDPQILSERQIRQNTRTAFRFFANLTLNHAEALYGTQGRQIVKAAWKTVKVLP